MTILKLLFGARQSRASQDSPQDQTTTSNDGAAKPTPPKPIVDGGDNTAANAPIQAAASTPVNVPRSRPRSITISRPNPRSGRVKTRLMSYGQLDAVLDELEMANGNVDGSISRPVGWLVVIEGPGTGAWYTLESGLTQVGRGPDQTICLDFGDTAISRSAHASIAYEPADHRFRLGPGKCENEVLLNGTPIYSTTDLTHGDRITVGETTLRLAAFCDDRFSWAPIIDKGNKDALSA